jgi:hypothetical protein
MKTKIAAALAAASILTVGITAGAATKAPATWDNLVKAPSKRLDAVYLLPGADFRGYTKVQIDTPEVAFQKDWLRDYNRSSMSLGNRMSEADAAKILERARTGFEEIFTKAYAEAGYQVVTTPGPDVLRLRTGVVNLRISAPEQMTAGRSISFAADAGQATLVLEARDSMSGALLGRALDSRLAGDSTRGRRTSISNISDFSLLFEQWAKISARGLAELKALSPIGAGATAAK